MISDFVILRFRDFFNVEARACSVNLKIPKSWNPKIQKSRNPEIVL
jgi:hypothetical protein